MNTLESEHALTDLAAGDVDTIQTIHSDWDAYETFGAMQTFLRRSAMSCLKKQRKALSAGGSGAKWGASANRLEDTHRLLGRKRVSLRGRMTVGEVLLVGGELPKPLSNYFEIEEVSNDG